MAAVDIEAALSFLATHGRVLDRRRVQVVLGRDDPSATLAALDGYRNDDGGYGWGLEPDLRSPESQPAAAMHALEVLAEAAPATTPHAKELCDWLASITLADGGLPFALPAADNAGNAPFWSNPDTATSSLQMTAQVAGNGHLVARHDPAVADHPWLGRATDWCLATIAALTSGPAAHELLFAVRFLDAVAPVEPRALDLLDRLGEYLPADGVVAVAGGAEGEVLRPLDFAPHPKGAARDLFDEGVIDGELERLATQQQPDGGWTVTFAAASPAAALEWRGYATVAAVTLLK